MTSKVFLDTAYAVALLIERDQYHEKARQPTAQIKEERPRLVTTRAVLIEIGNFLAKTHRLEKGIAFLEEIERSTAVEIVTVTDDLYQGGVRLLKKRLDKEWGLTDCISFVLMEEQGDKRSSHK